MCSHSVSHVGTGDEGPSDVQRTKTLPQPALHVHALPEKTKRVSRKDSCVLFAVAFAGVVLIVAISLSGFLMTHLTSNVFSAQGFMTNMLATINKKLEETVDPVYKHLQTSLTHIRFQNVDTWDGMSALTPWRLSFLGNFFKNHRRTSFDLANMAFDQEDVEAEGGYKEWLPPHEEADDFGDDRAIGSALYVGWSGFVTNTTEVRTFYEEGSNTNDWWISIRNDTTYHELAFFPMSLVNDSRLPADFSRRYMLFSFWSDIHQWDLQPRQVHFGNVFIQDIISPNALFVDAVMPVYERNTPGVDAGRRVRLTSVGFELPFITEQLSLLNLQGGFVFLVENRTGYLVAASDPSLSVLGDGENGTGTEYIYPIDSAHPLVRGAALNLKSTDSWPTLSDQLVQGEIDGVNHFFQCFLFNRYNLSLVGVYVIPAHIILGDVSSRAVLGSVFNVVCSVVLVVSIFAGVCHRFRKIQRDAQQRSRILKLKVQEVNLAVGIAEKLANYDLRAAEEVLRGQDFASENLATPLQQLLDNLTSYAPFLPDSLFTRLHNTEARRGTPNETLAAAMEGKTASLRSVEACALRLRDPSYTLLAFARDVETAFPELILYTTAETLSSGLDARDGFERTMGALYATYCLLRLDLDGKEIFSFGVDACGCALREPKDHHQKKLEFYSNMNWRDVTDLVVRADLLRLDALGKIVVHHDRVVALLVLTAVHGVMKNTALLPRVLPQHAQYNGYRAGARINDHGVALAYIMECFPHLLPSYCSLEPGQRAPILLTQGKVDFNSGWLVQGEAPPSLLFSKFKQVISRGRASNADISFYLVHWLTDLVGAEAYDGRPWPGAEKFTIQFPVRVLGSFIDSFDFVGRLAGQSEVEVMEDYLTNRWEERGLPPPQKKSTSTIALQRLTLMAQGFEQDVVDAFSLLPPRDKTCLTEELARTGHKVQFERAPVSVTSVPQGPALMVYYAPALLQKAGATEALEALMVLAAVLRAARRLFPCQVGSVESTATIRIDALKVLTPSTIAQKKEWYVSRIGDLDAEVVQGTLHKKKTDGTARLDLQNICVQLGLENPFCVAVHHV